MARKTIRSEYEREFNRLQRAVRRAESRGYFFDEPPLPKRVKRPTRASVNRLKNISTSTIYDKARVVLAETGEIISGTEARRLERSYAAKKAAETRRRNREIKATQVQQQTTLPKLTDVIINRFLTHLSRFPTLAEPLLKNWLDTLIQQNGKEAVAQMLEDGRANGIMLDNKVAYSNEIYTYMSDMLDYLPMDNNQKQQLTDAFEWEEDVEWPE